MSLSLLSVSWKTLLIGDARRCSLPGAVGMYALSLGIANVGEVLPAPAYAFLSGLNAATVGIIALAAVQLSQKAITDKITRVVVFLGASAGMLNSALWFFPLLMLLAGVVTIVWDFRWLHPLYRGLVEGVRRIRRALARNNAGTGNTSRPQGIEGKDAAS